MIHHRVLQYSDEWFSVRSGIPTASEFHRIVTPTGTPSKQAAAYRYRLIAERLMNIRPKQTDDYWIQRGHDLEPEAAQLFEHEHGLRADLCGFITTDDGRMGCSPDRMHGDELVEIKCPAPWTQVGYLLDGPGDQYKAQVQGQLMITEAAAVHFYSYHPAKPSAYRYTLRDDFFIKQLRQRLIDFCDFLDFETERCRKMGVFIPVPVSEEAFLKQLEVEGRA